MSFDAPTTSTLGLGPRAAPQHLGQLWLPGHGPCPPTHGTRSGTGSGSWWVLSTPSPLASPHISGKRIHLFHKAGGNWIERWIEKIEKMILESKNDVETGSSHSLTKVQAYR